MQTQPQRTLHHATALAALFALWLWAHPYAGLYHDAKIYVVQALYHLQPQIFSQDLFFLYGSQDKYTLFSGFYAQAINVLGLSLAVLVLTLLGQSLWFAGAAWLLSRLASGFVFWLALAFIAVSPRYYGSDQIFSYGEYYITPRVFAESLGLIALGFAVAKRWGWATGFGLLALATHPLMALSVAGTMLLYYGLQQSRQRVWQGVAVLVMAGAVLLCLPPFNQLLQVMDEQWYQLVLKRSPFLDVTQWSYKDWMPVLVNFCLLGVGVLAADARLKKLLLAVVIVSVLGLAFNVLAIMLKNPLLLQLQTWRCLWLSQCMAYFTFAWFVGTYWRRFEVARAVVLVLVCAWLMRESLGALLAVLALAAWVWQSLNTTEQTLPRSVWIGVYLLLFQSLVWFVLDLQFNIRLAGFFDFRGRLADQMFFKYGSGIIVIPVFLFIWRFKAKLTAWMSVLMAFMTAITLGLVLWDWWGKQDAVALPRTPLAVGQFAAFRQLIPENSNVYWDWRKDDENAFNVWLLLGRRSYISSAQTAGIVFNRQTAMEALRRTGQIYPLSQRDQARAMTWKKAQTGAVPPKVTKDSLILACQDPLLNFVVFNGAIANATELAHLTDTEKGQTYYLYDCNSFVGEHKPL